MLTNPTSDLARVLGFTPFGETAGRLQLWAQEGGPLGPCASWSPALVAYLRLIFEARQPMFLAWGPELTFLYNEEYAPILGHKHPSAIGRPFAEVWSDIWPQISPLVESTLAGQASWHEDLLIQTTRNGQEENAWFSFSYTPIRDEAGAVAGMLCAATETTENVLARQRTLMEREQLHDMFQQAPGIMCMDVGPQARLRTYEPCVPAAGRGQGSHWQGRR